MYSLMLLERGLVAAIQTAVTAQTLTYPNLNGDLVPIQVYAGDIPRDGAGQIDVTEIQEAPSVVVEICETEIGKTDGVVTVEIVMSAYEDKNIQDMSGHNYVQNMYDVISLYLCRNRKIINSYPLEFPLKFKALGRDAYPIFAGVLTVHYKTFTPDSDASDSIYSTTGTPGHGSGCAPISVIEM